MKTEPLSTQRHLVGRRLQMADTALHTKYVFPFVDGSWSVTFFLIDAGIQGPRLFRGSLEVQPGGLQSPEPSSMLEPLTAMPPNRFDEVIHFDPWWAFRGIAGVDRVWRDAVIGSNIAGSVNHEGTDYKVHDLEFDLHLKTLGALVAKDAFFRAASFHRGDLELLQLRKPPRA